MVKLSKLVDISNLYFKWGMNRLLDTQRNGRSTTGCGFAQSSRPLLNLGLKSFKNTYWFLQSLDAVHISPAAAVQSRQSVRPCVRAPVGSSVHPSIHLFIIGLYVYLPVYLLNYLFHPKRTFIIRIFRECLIIIIIGKCFIKIL